MRTEDDIEMYFTNNHHVMFTIADGRMLTFDQEGYIVEKHCSLYESDAPKVHLESPIFDSLKYFVLQDRNNEKKFSLILETDKN